MRIWHWVWVVCAVCAGPLGCSAAGGGLGGVLRAKSARLGRVLASFWSGQDLAGDADPIKAAPERVPWIELDSILENPSQYTAYAPREGLDAKGWDESLGPSDRIRAIYNHLNPQSKPTIPMAAVYDLLAPRRPLRLPPARPFRQNFIPSPRPATRSPPLAPPSRRLVSAPSPTRSPLSRLSMTAGPPPAGAPLIPPRRRLDPRTKNSSGSSSRVTFSEFQRLFDAGVLELDTVWTQLVTQHRVAHPSGFVYPDRTAVVKKIFDHFDEDASGFLRHRELSLLIAETTPDSVGAAEYDTFLRMCKTARDRCPEPGISLRGLGVLYRTHGELLDDWVSLREDAPNLRFEFGVRVVFYEDAALSEDAFWQPTRLKSSTKTNPDRNRIEALGDAYLDAAGDAIYSIVRGHTCDQGVIEWPNHPLNSLNTLSLGMNRMANALSDGARRRLYRHVDAADSDGSGCLDRTELASVDPDSPLGRVLDRWKSHHNGLNATASGESVCPRSLVAAAAEAEALSLLSEFDADGNGELRYDEYYTFQTRANISIGIVGYRHPNSTQIRDTLKTQTAREKCTHRDEPSPGRDQCFPRTVHQTWKSAQRVPMYAASWMQSWLRKNQGWMHVFWSDDDNRLLVKRRLALLLPFFDSLRPVEQADVARYLYLYFFGGVYADMDFECLRPIDGVRPRLDYRRAAGFVGQEPRLHTRLLEHRKGLLLSNAILASPGGLPLWLHLVLEIVLGLLSPSARGDPVSSTGPRVLTTVFQKLHGYHTAASNVTTELNRINAPDLLALPDHMLYPEIAWWNIESMRRRCDADRAKDNEEKELCWRLDRMGRNHSFGRTQESFAVHHWMCTWCRGDQSHDQYVTLADLMPKGANRTRPAFGNSSFGGSQGVWFRRY